MAQRALDRVVRASIGGRAEEIRISIGQQITAAEILMTVAHGGVGFDVIAFLRPDQARRIVIGMPAHVIPSAVNKAEFGSIRGTVLSISEEPVSKQQANALLRNEALAERFTSGGESFLVRITLIEDADSKSGFKWWPGMRPDFPINIGTLASVEIVLEERAPVTLVVPAMRQFLGV